ncbi:MAG: acyltransferase [Bacteroidetes bacterium]|nr:acyltransferase [Bacteroidota bacterium]
MKQIPIIESLRAIAAWSVCLYHFICTVTGFIGNESVKQVFSYGQYGVHVFFVISGFIIPWSMFNANYKPSSFFRFILKRIVRLDPPYICSILLVLAILFLKTKIGYDYGKQEPVTITGVILHLGYLINFFPNYHWLNNVYWTLAIEFQYYILMALIYGLFISSALSKRLIAYALCFISSLLLLKYRTHFPAYAPLFLTGIAVFQFKCHLTRKTELACVLIAAAMYNFFALGADITIIGILTALCILFFDRINIPFLGWMGKFSYSVYLVHCIIGVAIINILAHYPLTFMQKTGVLLLGILITFGSSWLMYYMIEKPSKKLSSKIRFR